MDSFLSWKRSLNGANLYNTLNKDPFGDGFAVKTWTPVPQSQFGEIYLRGTGMRSLQGNLNWDLPETDRGAVTFEVANAPDQLMIDLGGYRSDLLYYTIVIGRGPYAGVLRKQLQGSMMSYQEYNYLPLSGVHYDSSFYLDDAPVTLWMVYDYGHIEVGVGSSPESGRVILRAYDSQAAPGLQLVQFGTWRNSDDRVSSVRNVQMWRKN